MSNIIKKEMTLEECLNTLSEKEKEELSKTIKTELEIKGKVKQEDIMEFIISAFTVSLFIFPEDAVKDLENLANGKKVTNIYPVFISTHAVFEIDGEYVLPKELKEIVLDSVVNEERKQLKLNTLVSFYMSANGVLPINKLQELLKKSGFSATKKEILKEVQELEFIEKGDLIYYNEFLERFDEDGELSKEKESKEYRVFENPELFLTTCLDIEGDIFDKLDKFFAKKIKDESEREYVINKILSFLKLGYEIDETVEIALKEIKLTDKEQEKLDDILVEYLYLVPLWLENGYSMGDLIDAEDDEMSDEEIIKEYIHYYLLMNGVMEIEKLKNIMEEEHGFSLTNKEISSVIKELSNFELSGKYIQIKGLPKEDRAEILERKEQLKVYKVIDNLDEVYENEEKVDDKLEEIEDKYKLDEEIIVEFKSIMYFGVMEREIVESVLKDYDFNLPSNKIKSLTVELKEIAKSMPIWFLNGYSKRELNSIGHEKKVGRNEPCPCGSGKKYKKCCGK